MKKPKPYKKSTYSAAEINNFLKEKYKISFSPYWKEIFSECPSRESNLICIIYELCEEDCLFGDTSKYKKYIDILAKEFKNNADEEGCIEVENDL